MNLFAGFILTSLLVFVINLPTGYTPMCYGGIGAQVDNEDADGYRFVMMVLANTPAEEIGLQFGDRIREIDREEIGGLEGTEVVLEVIRDDEILIFVVKRQMVCI